MKKIIAVILAAVMVLGIGCIAFGAGSYKPSGGGSSYSGGSSSGGGGSSVIRSGSGTATTTVTGATGAEGTWRAGSSEDWYFENYNSQWGLINNPYASGGARAQWFFFDANGKMLTGWVWIKGADGVTRCYYLNPNHDGSFGACYLNGKTPDGWTVDASGAWTVDGVVQTK